MDTSTFLKTMKALGIKEERAELGFYYHLQHKYGEIRVAPIAFRPYRAFMVSTFTTVPEVPHRIKYGTRRLGEEECMDLIDTDVTKIRSEWLIRRMIGATEWHLQWTDAGIRSLP